MSSILLIYHFFHPDTVVSARLFSDLAEDLSKEHDVTVFTGNRLIRSDETLSCEEQWHGVRICRFSRPNFRQGSNVGRLVNSAILQLKWLWGFWKRRKEFDAVVVGTDPQFAYMMFPWMRLFSKRVRIIHWVFDLYPEAILVNSPKWMRMLASLTKPFIPWAYRRVDDMVDIGECMRARLKAYKNGATYTTLTPWALAEASEPPKVDVAIREQLFGKAKLGFLYSGTVGYAHDLGPFVALARECRRRGLDVGFCFAGYGNQYSAQTGVLTDEDTNVRLAGFASEEELAGRLASADFHLISLRQGWEGIVVPSKFFGALAMGRPVLYSGPGDSCIAGWCREHGIGLVLDDVSAMADCLEALLADDAGVASMQQKAFEAYVKYFSRRVVVDGWKRLLARKK